MTNEIEEILSLLNSSSWSNEAKQLKDYLTNLQQENLSLAKENEQEKQFIKDCGFKNVQQLALDYIGIRQENERLKEENKHIFANVNDDQLLRSNAMNWAEAQDYKQRIDKANSILNKLVIMKPWENTDDPMRKIYRPIKNTTKQEVYRAIVELEDILRGDE